MTLILGRGSLAQMKHLAPLVLLVAGCSTPDVMPDYLELGYWLAEDEGQVARAGIGLDQEGVGVTLGWRLSPSEVVVVQTPPEPFDPESEVARLRAELGATREELVDARVRVERLEGDVAGGGAAPVFRESVGAREDGLSTGQMVSAISAAAILLAGGGSLALKGKGGEQG